MKTNGIVVILALAAGWVSAGAQQGEPAFEVASVRANRTDSQNSNASRVTGNRYAATNVSVVSLLRVAYEIQEFQIAGQPAWAERDRFDIVATVPDGARPEDWRLMVQALLRDRFKLRFHREQRPAPMFALTVVKSGHRLTPAGPCKSPNGRCDFNGSPTRVWGESVSMAQLATRLSRSLGVMVVDRTGLSSLFDVSLEWTVEDQFRGRGASASPTIFTAIQDQLGLKLESTTGPVDTLVVDSVEPPADN